MISSRVNGLSADTCDFCEHVDFWLVAPKLILLFDKLGAADNVLELDRLSSRDRIVELSLIFSKPWSLNFLLEFVYLKIFTFTNLGVYHEC